ncbi:CLUMA_CG004723, isoform A [Clunio marinus]|uniref:CLUMA_CG004723, isoform A n=1 Tax=Clunio marinus TaxID=568069 RepID=A0A1J1HSR5_9DIPT|nr:CLUMA_CG004723, isoform A [Clunio marinus]
MSRRNGLNEGYEIMLFIHKGSSKYKAAIHHQQCWNHFKKKKQSDVIQQKMSNDNNRDVGLNAFKSFNKRMINLYRHLLMIPFHYTSSELFKFDDLEQEAMVCKLANQVRHCLLVSHPHKTLSNAIEK